MATVKNTGAGPRGVRAKDGSITWIEAGQTADVDHDGNLHSDVKEVKAEPKKADAKD